MTSIYPMSGYGNPPTTGAAYPPYGNQPPIGAPYGTQPPPVYDPQQPPSGGYYAATPGAAPPQGYYAPPGTAPPQGYYAPPGTAPPPGYYAPPGSAPPPGSAMPPGSAQPPGYAMPQQQAWVDPATGAAIPYSQAPIRSYPAPNGTAVAIPIAQSMSYPVPTAQFGYGAPPIKQQDENPANRIETGRWSAGLCDCCNNCVPNLCMSWCCPCISLAQIYARIALGRYYVILARLLVLTVGAVIVRFIAPQRTGQFTASYDTNGNYTYSSAGTDVASMAGMIAYILLEVVLAMHVFHARMRVRQRFQIPGNGFYDCLASCCCSCCAIAQMATHVKSYKPGDCSFDAPDVLPPFGGY